MTFVGWITRSRNPTSWRVIVGLRDKAANPTCNHLPIDMEWNLEGNPEEVFLTAAPGGMQFQGRVPAGGFLFVGIPVGDDGVRCAGAEVLVPVAEKPAEVFSIVGTHCDFRDVIHQDGRDAHVGLSTFGLGLMRRMDAARRH
jgi:hypothetical protein